MWVGITKKKKIKILSQNILIIEIYIKLYKLSKNDEDIDVKIYISDFFFKDLREDKLNDIVKFVKNLDKKEDYIEIMDKIGKNYIISESDYFSSENINKINLLFSLNDNGLLREENENNYFIGSKQRLKNIYDAIEGNKLSVKQLDIIVKEKDEDILKKLDLLKLTNKVINSKNIYNSLVDQQKQISDNISILEDIMNCLVKFHSTKNKEDIEDIADIIEKVPNGTIADYNKKKLKIEKLKALKTKADKIKEVMNDDIFKNICYKSVNEADEDKHFNIALEKYNKMIKSGEGYDGELNNYLLNNFDEKCQINFKNKLMKKGNTRCATLVEVKNYEKEINSIFYFSSERDCVIFLCYTLL